MAGLRKRLRKLYYSTRTIYLNLRSKLRRLITQEHGKVRCNHQLYGGHLSTGRICLSSWTGTRYFYCRHTARTLSIFRVSSWIVEGEYRSTYFLCVIYFAYISLTICLIYLCFESILIFVMTELKKSRFLEMSTCWRPIYNHIATEVFPMQWTSRWT